MENPIEDVSHSEDTDPSASSNETETKSSSSDSSSPATPSYFTAYDIQLFRTLIGILDSNRKPWTLEPSLQTVMEEFQFVVEIMDNINQGTVAFDGDEHSEVLLDMLENLSQELASEITKLAREMQRISTHFAAMEGWPKLE